MAAATRTITVGLGPRSYDIVVGAGILPTLGQHAAAVFGDDGPQRRGALRHAFIVRDTGVPDAAFAEASRSLADAGYETRAFALTPSEEAKTLATAQAILTALARSRHERADPVVALGGGVTGDVAGFAAAVYRRGVPVVQCPTTLLAMVDASVGGKTGVNLEVGSSGGGGGALLKNLVGAFHQPSFVLCDVALLATLADDEFRGGLAECIKHGLIGGDWRDPDLLEWTRSSLGPILARDEAHLVELVARNVAVKAAVVMSDERETGDGPGGGRLALNAGHTVAHAIETIPAGGGGGGHLKHGDAVAIGLVAEAVMGERLGATLRGTADRLRDTLAAAGLPTAAPGLAPSDVVLGRMRDDKKTTGGRLRLPLPSGEGRCRVVIDPPEEAVLAGIEAVLAAHPRA